MTAIPDAELARTVRTRADVDKMRTINPMEEMAYLMDAIRMVRRELNGRVPLIGFSGAPFTLACYMVEGKGSREFPNLKQLMYSAPEVYRSLMDAGVHMATGTDSPIEPENPMMM